MEGWHDKRHPAILSTQPTIECNTKLDDLIDFWRDKIEVCEDIKMREMMSEVLDYFFDIRLCFQNLHRIENRSHSFQASDKVAPLYIHNHFIVSLRDLFKDFKDC